MSATEDHLTALNVEIGGREEAGDVPYFQELLAPVFAMRRARDHDAFIDRLGFINDVRPSPDRHTAEVETMFESDRCAVVTCLVRMTPVDATEQNTYRNVRVFIRGDTEQPWSLLAWVNESVPMSAEVVGRA